MLYSVVWRVPVWSGVWGRDESVFGDLSISLSHVLVDFKRLYSTVFMIHGCPYSLQVDNASYFKGTVMQSLTQLFGIKHLAVLGYQPTSNGSAEAVVKKVSNALQRHGNARPGLAKVKGKLERTGQGASLISV